MKLSRAIYEKKISLAFICYGQKLSFKLTNVFQNEMSVETYVKRKYTAEIFQR